MVGRRRNLSLTQSGVTRGLYPPSGVTGPRDPPTEVHIPQAIGRLWAHRAVLRWTAPWETQWGQLDGGGAAGAVATAWPLPSSDFGHPTFGTILGRPRDARRHRAAPCPAAGTR